VPAQIVLGRLSAGCLGMLLSLLGNGRDKMRSNHRRLYLLLFLGISVLFLYSCSPPPWDLAVVERIGINNGVIIVRAVRDCSCEKYGDYIYFFSNDYGKNWVETSLPTNDILQTLDHNVGNPASICLSDDKYICYKITDQESVDISNDGGATWQVDWQIPVGRKYYMQRSRSYPGPDTVPLDIILTESSSGPFVIVAMGNQGILVKSPDGNWNRYAVGKAVPTPYYANNFSQANGVLNNEQLVLMLLALCGFLLLSLVAWILSYIYANKIISKKILRAFSPLGISVLVFIICYFLGFVGPRYISDIIENFQLIIIPLPLLGFMITWIWMITVSTRKWYGLLTFIASAGLPILSYFCLLFPFQLWALGGIPVYETGKTIAWGLGVAVFLLSMFVIWKLASFSVKQFDEVKVNL
jgi:hypothetical protein